MKHNDSPLFLLGYAERRIERAMSLLPQTESDLWHLTEALAHLAAARIQIRENLKK